MSSKWLIFFCSLVFAYFAKIVFIPLFLSIFSAILLDPIVTKISNKNISRHFATGIVISVFLLFSVAALWVAYASVTSLASDSSGLAQNAKQVSIWVKDITTKLDHSIHANITTKPTSSDVQKVQIVDNYPSWTSYIVSGVGSLSEIASMAFFVPLMLFYFLYDKEILLESFNALIGKHCHLPKLNLELPKMIRAFVIANAVTYTVLLICHALVLYFLGFNNWIPLTMITAFASLLPLAGAPIAILLALTQGTAQSETSYPFFIVTVAFLLFHALANNLVMPQLAGSKINVNSVSLIFGLLFWGWLWGAMGLILAVPMTALIKIFLESNPQSVPLANLLSTKPRLVNGQKSNIQTV